MTVKREQVMIKNILIVVFCHIDSPLQSFNDFDISIHPVSILALKISTYICDSEVIKYMLSTVYFWFYYRRVIYASFPAIIDG